MNSSGDAAEQVVRLSLDLRLTGSAAKNIAAALYTILKNRDKTKTAGRQRLTAMLKSGKELKVFTLPEEHLKQFTVEAKRYGVVYCALRGKAPSADGLVDIMVRAEDASKINRIVERFKLATVDAASIKHEIEQSRAEKAEAPAEKAEAPAAPEQNMPDKAEEDRLLDNLMGAPTKMEEHESPNPSVARTEKSPPSAPTSKTQPKAAEGTAKRPEDRPSVREDLREIKEARKQKEAETHAAAEPERSPRAESPKPVQHHQPPRKKPKKTKAR